LLNVYSFVVASVSSVGTHYSRLQNSNCFALQKYTTSFYDFFSIARETIMILCLWKFFHETRP